MFENLDFGSVFMGKLILGATSEVLLKLTDFLGILYICMCTSLTDMTASSVATIALVWGPIQH